jgi:hypothetical protein
MGIKVRGEKITHFSFIKITKMYNDKKNYSNCLGLWICYTLTKKKTNYISKQTYYKNVFKKTRIK